MIRTYKILSLLLSYPSEELQEFLPEAIKELTAEGLLGADQMVGVSEFAEQWGRRDLMDWQAEYVQLFDTGKAASLYLFEHLKGESKDRGQAMVDLMEHYRSRGMQLSSSELPDFLPVFLEFLSSLPQEEAAETLSGAVNVISLIHGRLAAKNNIYRHIHGAIVYLSATAPELPAGSVLSVADETENPDRSYDEPVSFGNVNPCINCK